MLKSVDHIFDTIFSVKSQKSFEKYILILATGGFILHLLLIFLNKYGYINFTFNDTLLLDPISALYTPFSILLVYEVYQLIRTIPESFSSSVGKQYEIATLLVVRDILKRLSEVENTEGWNFSSDLGFLLVECAAFLALLYTSLTYFKMSNSSGKSETMADDIAIFVEAKRGIANAMLIIFLIMATYSLYSWVGSVQEGGGSVSRIIFFLDFFTLLILTDILILLISYWFYTDFGNLARNTGFVLSTVIIRVAISSEGVSSMILFTLSGLLGIAILRMFILNEQVVSQNSERENMMEVEA